MKARIHRMFSRSRLRAASRNLRISNPSIPNAFTMRLPVIVSCRIWLKSARRARLFSDERRMRRPSLPTGHTTSGINTADPTAIRQSMSKRTATNAISANTCRKKSASQSEKALRICSMSLMTADITRPTALCWKKPTGCSTIFLYASLRRSVTPDKPTNWIRMLPKYSATPLIKVRNRRATAKTDQT